MSPESKKPNISFEEVISKSKEIVLQAGHHKPVLILDDIQSPITIEIWIQNIPPTHGEALDLFRFLVKQEQKVEPFKNCGKYLWYLRPGTLYLKTMMRNTSKFPKLPTE